MAVNIDVSMAIVVPTYGREQVLLETIQSLTKLDPPATKIIIIDQTSVHEAITEGSLRRLASAGSITWLRLTRPSIPTAMNLGLRESREQVVLFVDDDVVPQVDLAKAHANCYRSKEVWAVSGRVFQPGQSPLPIVEIPQGAGLSRDLKFPFNGTARRPVFNCMAGNLSVRRAQALDAGGFDENFLGDSYRFETEFCRRLNRSGGVTMFEPSAVVRHLQLSTGGVRAAGDHRRSLQPEYSMGEYYFAFKESEGSERATFMLHRLLRSVLTRYHLSHPWMIPVKLIGELRGLRLAWRLYRAGPRLLGNL